MVTAVDDGAMRWSWVVRIGPVAMTVHHGLTAVPAGTRAGLVIKGPAALVTAYAPLTRVALARLVAP